MSLLDGAGEPRRRFYRWLLDRLAPDAVSPAGKEPWPQALHPSPPPSLLLHPETPEALRQSLRPEARRIAAANLLRVHHFQRLARALEGLAFCPLKGIYLLATIYAEDLSSRSMSDLDILVPLGASQEAVARLCHTLGLREIQGGPGAPERCLVGEGLAGEGLVVEVHERLGIKHGWASTWEDLAPSPGEAHECAVWVLDSETTLVHLVSHFVKHGPFSDLRWVEDILRWQEREIDPLRVVAKARRMGAWRSLVAGAEALRRVLGEDLLPQVPGSSRGSARGTASRLIRAHERTLWSYLRQDPLSAPRHLTSLRRNLSALLLADRPRDAVRFFRAKLAELRRRRRPPSGPRP